MSTIPEALTEVSPTAFGMDAKFHAHTGPRDTVIEEVSKPRVLLGSGICLAYWIPPNPAANYHLPTPEESLRGRLVVNPGEPRTRENKTSPCSPL